MLLDSLFCATHLEAPPPPPPLYISPLPLHSSLTPRQPTCEVSPASVRVLTRRARRSSRNPCALGEAAARSRVQAFLPRALTDLVARHSFRKICVSGSVLQEARGGDYNMAKFLLVAAAAVAMSSWTGGGGLMAAAQRSFPLLFSDDLPKLELVSNERPACVAQSKVGGGLCEEDPDYDDRIKQHVSLLLAQDRGINALVNDPSLRNILNDVEPELEVNIRFSVTETPVCAAQETLIYPKRAKTPRDDWVFVLNQEGVQQALRVEKCISDGSTCSIGSVLPGDAKATCRQKYVYRRMLVLGTNKIQPEEVLMPSCCVCYTTYQDLLTRSRNGTRSQTPAPPAAAPAAPPVGAPAQPPMVPATQPIPHPTSFRPMNLNFGRSLHSNRRFIMYPGGR